MKYSVSVAAKQNKRFSSKALWKSLLEAAQNRVFVFSLGVFFLYSKRHVPTTLFVLGYTSIFFLCILSNQFYPF